jgi:pSer/pThr/pTyr-binding forkhead associated (FHA) protein
MPRRLVVLEGPPGGPDPGVSLALHPQTTIGRAADNVLVVGDPAVSGHHARVVLRDDAWWVEDLGSTNGTQVNDQWVSAPVAVAVGDEIQVGPARFRLAA